jgi:hypothetical protein
VVVRYNTLCGSIRKLVAEIGKLDEHVEAKRTAGERLAQKLYG